MPTNLEVHNDNEQMTATTVDERREETYKVDTPASIEEDTVNAKDNNNKTLSEDSPEISFKHVQHCSPMRNAKRMTGAVYCPSTL